MIKVLVVDDDKLVRKGLISMLPWQAFGMEVIGEANNGEKALEFLEEQSVDLLLTDLAMPVMSGIELMRIVRKRFPRLHVVVLTLHQDFEYIQEALRLGAIDYIAKVELEKEQLDDVLARIVGRIQEQTNVGAVQRSFNEPVFLTFQSGYAVICLDGDFDGSWAEDLSLPAHVGLMEADRSSWLFISEEEDDTNLYRQLSSKVSTTENIALVELHDAAQMPWNEYQRWVRDFAERELFYEYRPDNKIIKACMYNGNQLQHEPNDEGLDRLKELWLSAEWLYSDFLFCNFVREIRLLRMPQARLIGLLYAYVNEWNRILSHTKLGKIKLAEPIHCWYQIEQWIEGIRERIRLAANQTNYSEEIINCILKAEQIMRSEMAQPLTAAEVAKRMNMSRSYFSQCFKDIIGNTFNERIRMIRMEKAKMYLLSTNKTIQWIAENTGYTDEKYFSRSFRELTGMLPSEYRNNNLASKS
ncbi:response regulator [Paenibacillus thermotolerans]|uniref:response regulator n=1 Tax=Paenibacillus thermotolerans TaxID=3027807 RepID=UPI0023677268|nr:MULTISPECIES: response regulator [unclassified Paenibacillus]